MRAEGRTYRQEVRPSVRWRGVRWIVFCWTGELAPGAWRLALEASEGSRPSTDPRSVVQSATDAVRGVGAPQAHRCRRRVDDRGATGCPHRPVRRGSGGTAAVAHRVVSFDHVPHHFTYLYEHCPGPQAAFATPPRAVLSCGPPRIPILGCIGRLSDLVNCLGHSLS